MLIPSCRWTAHSRRSFISCWTGRARCTWTWQPFTSSSLAPPPPPPCIHSSAITITTTSHHHKTCTHSPHGSPHTQSVAAARLIDIEAIERRLRELGVDENTIRFALGDPQHTCRIQWTTVKLVLDEGFHTRDISSLLNQQIFLIPHQKLVTLLDFLKTLHITGQSAGRFLVKGYRIIRYKIERLQAKLELLKSFGLEPEKIRRTITVNPRIFFNSNDTLRRRVAWLQDLGVDRKGTQRILQRHPFLLNRDLGKCLLPKIALLESMGVSRASILKAISTRSTVFMLSLAKFAGKIEFYQQLGFEKDSQYFFPVLTNLGVLSSEKVLIRYNTLIARGLSPDEMRRIVELCPTVFCSSEATVSKKINYLIEIMNLDIKEIVRCPAFMRLSLEKRIIPRFKLLTDAIEKGKVGTGEKGLLGSGLRLSSVIGLTDKKFHEWFLKREGKRKIRRKDHRRERKKGRGQNK